MIESAVTLGSTVRSIKLVVFPSSTPGTLNPSSLILSTFHWNVIPVSCRVLSTALVIGSISCFNLSSEVPLDPPEITVLAYISPEASIDTSSLAMESEGITSLLEKIPFGKIHKYNTNE